MDASICKRNMYIRQRQNCVTDITPVWKGENRFAEKMYKKNCSKAVTLIAIRW